jgi:hypothetical protein
VIRQNFGRRSATYVLLGALALASAAQARDKKAKIAPVATKDEIEVVGHIPATNGPIQGFFTTQHYSSYYLYAQHQAGQNVTLIDVTNVDHPAVLADVAAPGGGSESLSVVAGTAALVTSQPVSSAPPAAPQNFKIMDFSDPKNPQVAREFTGVTAMSRDERRGLIFVANADGIWILHQRLAEDPEVEKAYANYVIYGSSMYSPSR